MEAENKVNEDQLPIVANKKAIIMSKAGEIYSFDIQTGSRSSLRLFQERLKDSPSQERVFFILL